MKPKVEKLNYMKCAFAVLHRHRHTHTHTHTFIHMYILFYGKHGFSSKRMRAMTTNCNRNEKQDEREQMEKKYRMNANEMSERNGTW